MAAELSVRDLAISFDHGRVRPVRGVSLDIRPGEALGLVGESGSGKSLTARAIMGLLPAGAAVSGRVSYDGRSLLELPEAELRALRGARIAMIFQDPMSSLNPVVRVGAAIAQVIRSHERVGARAAQARAVELMERVGIRDAGPRARAFPHEFSGGMRQRIMIAMALAARPTLLLADEPTTALDVIVQAGILRLLDRLRREDGMSLLLVSHDLSVVASVCERVAVMYAGQVVEEGPTREVLFAPHMPYTVGLIDSVSRVAKGTRLRFIAGQPPSPWSFPESCAFAARCTLALEACRTQTIPPVAIRPGHWARCIRAAEIDRRHPEAAVA